MAPSRSKPKELQESKASANSIDAMGTLALGKEIVLALDVDSDSGSAPRPKTPGHKAITDEQIADKLNDFAARKSIKDDTTSDERALIQQLLLEEARLNELLDFVKKYNKSPNPSDAAHSRIDQLTKSFTQGMKSVLEALRPTEVAIRSLNAFFVEGGCDGTAKSVYLYNVDSSKFDTLSPLWKKTRGKNGDLPIMFKDLDNVNVFKSMCAAMAVAGEVTHQKEVHNWANQAMKSEAIVFLNAARSLCGPNTDFQVDSVVAEQLEKLGKICGVGKEYQHAVLLANHPIGRKKSQYDSDDVVVYPGFAVLGKLYFMEKVDTEETMCKSFVIPGKDQLSKSWMVDFDCPTIIQNRDSLDSANVIFLDKISDEKGSGVVEHFNSSVTTWTGDRVGLEETLAECWLKKIITHHLLTSRKPTKKEEALDLKAVLQAKLVRLKADGYFNECLVEDSDIVDVGGVPQLKLDIRVAYKQAIRKTTVTIKTGNMAG